ncbi:hypothetical protein P153DRAFT_329321 [Dothidotthia symphoricarpi CBS 119687]|uniref:Tyrosine specific protein phosphatases domain-containing protein n=1 Tax=Dothidotthia symphoricarpi CBS 119687 TaxID=1392245 RepID=A0A6A6ARZ7_9PLEO|nr:uncharacterized protein P153DRAFT_329321 [Dothidotthia symphoricarpi CBS 119687]KAF2134709.1 hypothetical protein P153DRAFT_329321 [Dothidotthia symphoricarpi CBS 119687]
MTTPTPPTPPFHPIPNIHNLRDPSLYPLSTPTGPIRPAILFRSADVSRLTAPDWISLHALGISHVFDLRSKPEVERGWTSGLGDGGAKNNDGGEGEGGGDRNRDRNRNGMAHANISHTWTPVFSATDYSPARLASRYVKYMDASPRGFVDAYRDILRNGGAAYRTILLFLASGGQGALVHCTAGKDRTGIFFGVLFDFLGVPRGDIAGEYELTEIGLRGVRDEVVGRVMRSEGLRAYMVSLMEGGAVRAAEGREEVHIPPEIQEKGRLAALRMIGARRESMLGALEMVDREWGGSEAYFRRECGLGEGELEALRRNLVVVRG